MPKPSTERMFSHVYATPNPQVDRQRAEFMDYLAGFDEDPESAEPAVAHGGGH